MLPLAADCVYAREGVVLNPHYRTMGGLYGSEYWTYTLPRRVGEEKALALTSECQPLGTSEAKAIGFIDDCFGESADEFEEILMNRAVELANHEHFWQLLSEKHDKRLRDERVRPLASYRAKELKHMHKNFYGADPAYHIARQKFVYKGRPPQRPEKRDQNIFGGQLSEANRAALRRSQLNLVAYFMLCAATVVLRHFADAPPFDEMNSLLQICLLGAAMMLGGVIAAIAAFLLVVGLDFFLIDPVFSLGIKDWRGLIELAFGSVLALGFGISASRVFPSLLDHPSHSLGSS
jgi:hypothetical protein